MTSLKSVAHSALAALMVLVLLVLAACGAPAPEQTGAAGSDPYGAEAASPVAEIIAQPQIRIAIMAPITGPAAPVGEAQLNFTRLAVADWNASHDLQIELIEGDTEIDPAKATTLAERLAADDTIYAIVGPAGSQVVASVAPVLAESGLALVSPSATRPDLTEQGLENLFRVVPRDDVQGITAADLIAETIGAQQVYLIDDQSSYGVGLADVMESELDSRGVNVVRESVSQDETDFSALVTRLQGDGTDAVFLATQIAAQGALMARQMQEQGVSAALLGSDGLMTEDLIKDAGGATEGVYATFFAPDVTSLESARPVIGAYQEQYGEVGPFGPPAYAATMVVLEAIERAYLSGDLSRATVLSEIAATNQADSLLGIPIAFDANGDIANATFFVYQVQDGAFVPVQ